MRIPPCVSGVFTVGTTWLCRGASSEGTEEKKAEAVLERRRGLSIKY